MKILEVMMHPAVMDQSLIYEDPKDYNFSVNGVYIELQNGTEIHLNIHHVVGVVVREQE